MKYTLEQRLELAQALGISPTQIAAHPPTLIWSSVVALRFRGLSDDGKHVEAVIPRGKWPVAS